MKILNFFEKEIFNFYSRKKSLYIAWASFRNENLLLLHSHFSGISRPNAVTSSDDESYGPAVLKTLPNSTAERARDKPAIGPVLPAHLQNKHKHQAESEDSDSDSDQETAGPALPPHLKHKSESLTSSRSHKKSKSRKVYGPVIPGHDDVNDDSSGSDDNDIGLVGPSVSMQATGQEGSTLEDFESRAKKMRDRLTGKVSVEKINDQTSNGND